VPVSSDITFLWKETRGERYRLAIRDFHLIESFSWLVGLRRPFSSERALEIQRRNNVAEEQDKMAQEIAELEALEGMPFVPRASGYIKRTGPGLLQSAMTLGAGSAAASVLAGASFGYKLLWVQPVAMFLGVMMLAALSNVVLTKSERPITSFSREMGRFGKFLVVFWVLGTIMSSVIWHFPQYGLAASAARDLGALSSVDSVPDAVLEAEAELNEAQKTKDDALIVPAKDNFKQVKKDTTFLGLGFTRAGLMISFILGFTILGINIVTTYNYGGDKKGVRIYEWFLRGCIALVVVMFGIVVVAKFGDIEWLEVGKGFIGYYGIPNLRLENGSLNMVTVMQVLGMLGAAVGINMTFLYPYTLLKKGWGPSHRKLAKWDLGMTMFLPFTLVTSLVIIAMTVGGVYEGADMVVTGLKPVGAAKALSGVLGERAGRTIFDLGFMGMTCGAISTHMVVCGFTFNEIFRSMGFEDSKMRFRIFALTPSIGLLGVVVGLPMWFPVAASAVCFTMLPIAYLSFLIMNNKRSYLGDAVGKGFSRGVFNALLIIALTMSIVGCGIMVYKRVYIPVGEKLGWIEKDDPVEEEPVDPEDDPVVVDADPVDVDPVDVDPVDVDPVDVDPVDADPVDANPVDADPVE
jgi:manganese transport protein